MKRHLFIHSRTCAVMGVILALLFGAFVLTACGGEEKPDPSQADISKSVVVEGWKITLTGVPDEAPVVGTGGVTHAAQNGTFVIIPATVTNQNTDILLFPDGLLVLKDSQGREFPPTGSTPQFAYLQAQPDKDMLMDSPVPAGGTRDTVLIFDVPEDARGLVMVVKPTGDTFKLGYKTP